MGTILSITVAGVPDAAAEAAVEAAFAEVDRLESILSDWRETSEVSRLNRAVGGEARAASPELLEVLQASLRWSERTGGAFDASVGPLTHLWRRAAEAELWPSAEEIEAARTRVGYRGIGKGYALDRAAAVLEKAGVHSALLDFGGQLLALDGPPGENAWTAGLRDPSRPAAVCATIGLVRASISTSADYERGISIDGKRASHILDPRTGKPVEGLLGASVVCPSATDADALSTALFVMGPEVGRRFSEEQELLAWLVASDGRSFETSSFRALRQEKGGAR
jgi:thiamine biosynthesis lipoprotein